MKILAIEEDVPGITGEQFEPYLEPEARQVWKLHQRGVLREIYFRDDMPNAVLVLECDGVQDACRILDSLPLVKQGLIRFELIPLKPYPGFARLFVD